MQGMKTDKDVFLASSELKRASELRKILEEQAKKQAELFKSNNIKSKL